MASSHPMALSNLLSDPPAASPPTNKRKAPDEARQEIDLWDDRCQQTTENCDQIRRKIRSFLETGEMNVTTFQRALGVNSKSYNLFMGYTGPSRGNQNGTYHCGSAFFKHRELNGVKVVRKKPRKEDEEKLTDVAGVRLEGEAARAVPVFDSCDQIRRKINEFLVQPNITQAAFLREIAKTYGDGRKIQSKLLTDFRSKKGALLGNTSSVYYASYVFFEKIRIRDGKKKSAHRIQMEELYPEGVDVESRNDGRTYSFVGDVVRGDQYGRM